MSAIGPLADVVAKFRSLVMPLNSTKFAARACPLLSTVPAIATNAAAAPWMARWLAPRRSHCLGASMVA